MGKSKIEEVRDITVDIIIYSCRAVDYRLRGDDNCTILQYIS